MIDITIKPSLWLINELQTTLFSHRIVIQKS